MKTLNPEHLKAVIEFLNKGPYLQHLDIKITEMGIGFSTVAAVVQRAHLDPFGNVHSGMTASVIGIAAFWSVYCECPEDAGFMPLDLKTDYLATTASGKLIVRGKRIKIGRSVCLAEAVVVDQNDKWIAHGTSKLLVREDLKYPKKEILELTGQVIPPKFI
jgi:uncharacterized protein (TIGR00369 family)